jgi:anti-sigma factor ChrR (cupin superfamily)
MLVSSAPPSQLREIALDTLGFGLDSLPREIDRWQFRTVKHERIEIKIDSERSVESGGSRPGRHHRQHRRRLHSPCPLSV